MADWRRGTMSLHKSTPACGVIWGSFLLEKQKRPSRSGAGVLRFRLELRLQVPGLRGGGTNRELNGLCQYFIAQEEGPLRGGEGMGAGEVFREWIQREVGVICRIAPTLLVQSLGRPACTKKRERIEINTQRKFHHWGGQKPIPRLEK